MSLRKGIGFCQQSEDENFSSKVKRNKQYVRSSVEPMFIVCEEFCSRFFPLDKTFTSIIGL